MIKGEGLVCIESRYGVMTRGRGATGLRSHLLKRTPIFVETHTNADVDTMEMAPLIVANLKQSTTTLNIKVVRKHVCRHES